MPAQATDPSVFDPQRLAHLSRGLLMTLRSLNDRTDGNAVTTARLLTISRFFKHFDAWIRELEQLAEPKATSDIEPPR